MTELREKIEKEIKYKASLITPHDGNPELAKAVGIKEGWFLSEVMLKSVVNGLSTLVSEELEKLKEKRKADGLITKGRVFNEDAGIGWNQATQEHNARVDAKIKELEQ